MLVNMTPHPITILNEDGEVEKEIPSSGIVPRVQYQRTLVEEVEEVKVWQQSQAEITDLPDFQEGVFVIVSKMVAEAAKRHDLIVPTDMVRNDDGVVLGCQGFTVIV